MKLITSAAVLALGLFATPAFATQLNCTLTVSDVSVDQGRYLYSNIREKQVSQNLVRDAEGLTMAQINENFEGYRFQAQAMQDGQDVMMSLNLIGRNANSNTQTVVDLRKNNFLPLLELLQSNTRAQITCIPQ